MSELIKVIRAHCVENYENGYDAIVEAYTDEELQEFIEQWGIKTLTQFIVSYQPIIDHAAEIRAEIF